MFHRRHSSGRRSPIRGHLETRWEVRFVYDVEILF